MRGRNLSGLDEGVEGVEFEGEGEGEGRRRRKESEGMLEAGRGSREFSKEVGSFHKAGQME